MSPLATQGAGPGAEVVVVAVAVVGELDGLGVLDVVPTRVVAGVEELLVDGLLVGLDEPPHAPNRTAADKATRAGVARTR
ncbi:MAG TPA: hypothetical protein VGL49_06340, partial [Acidimicrobiales bacterium]